MENKKRWYDTTTLLILAYPIFVALLTAAGQYALMNWHICNHEDRICAIERHGSPAVKSLKKDVRWIMDVMGDKWKITVPKDINEEG